MAQIQTKFIAANAVTNAKLATIPANSYLGNNTGTSATAAYITSTQLTANLNLFSSTLQGLVPASGGGTTNFLRADGTWATAGGGTVTAVSVVSANGFAGTSSGGATPALTLTTTITGVLKGNGTAISAATAGTDYSAGTSALASGILYSTTGTGALSIATVGQFPTLNQNTTGTAANVTGTVAIANGGTGQVTANAAFAALSPMTTAGDIIYENSTPVPARLGIGSTGQVLTVVSGLPAWSTPTSGTTTIGTFNSQTSAANGLVISGTTLYAQAATTTNPGMVSIPASGGLSLSTAALSINVDTSTSTTKINASNQLEAIQPHEDKFTLTSTNITNQYVDLSFVAQGASASNNSVSVYAVGGPTQQKAVDYTVSLTGGAGGVTRVTFAGDLATGGNAALVAGDVLVVDYAYLA